MHRPSSFGARHPCRAAVPAASIRFSVKNPRQAKRSPYNSSFQHGRCTGPLHERLNHRERPGQGVAELGVVDGAIVVGILTRRRGDAESFEGGIRTGFGRMRSAC